MAYAQDIKALLDSSNSYERAALEPYAFSPSKEMIESYESFFEFISLFLPSHDYEPEPTVVSFQGGSVGNNICEDGQALPYHGPNIGEDYDNACWDCGCLVDEYCDGVGGSANADNWNCVPMLAGSGIAVSNVASVFFPKYDSFNRDTQFEYFISNFPLQDSVDVSEEECSISSCVKTSLSGDTESCTAQCDFFGCSTIESDSFSRACTVEITGIDDYDSLFSYSVRPKISLNVTVTKPIYLLRDSGQGLAMSIEGEFPPLNFGASYCGDGVVDNSESESTCCYDTGCGEGFYCDIDSAEIPMTSSCVSESSISLDASMGQRSFFDTTVEHRTNIDITITGIPSGMAVELDSSTCEFGLTDELCGVENCEVVSDTGTEYKASCMLRIPPINFKESEFFDGISKVILNDGVFKLPITFNNGQGSRTLEIADELGSVDIEVQTSCPDAVCDFDESLGQSNECPADCGCPEGKFLVTEYDEDRGACLSDGEIILQILSVQPDPVYCLVTMNNVYINNYNFNGKSTQGQLAAMLWTMCQPDPVTIFARIVGGPDDIKLMGSEFTIDGETREVNCVSDQTFGNGYRCAFVFRNQRLGDMGPKQVDIIFNTEYSTLDAATGIATTMNKELRASATINMVKKIGLDVIATCQMAAQKNKNKINDMKKQISKLKMIVAVMAGITATLWVACIVSAGTNAVVCGFAVLATLATVCAAAPLLWGIGKLKDKINSQRNKRIAACEAITIGGMSRAGKESGASAAKAGGGVAGAICAVGAIVLSVLAPVAIPVIIGFSAGGLAVGAAAVASD